MTVGQVVPQLSANAAAPGGNRTNGGGTRGNAITGGGGSFVGSAFSQRLRNNNYCIYLHHNHTHSLMMKNCAHMGNGAVGSHPSFSKPHHRVGGYDSTMNFSLKSMRVNLRSLGYSGGSSFMPIVSGGGKGPGTPRPVVPGGNGKGETNRPAPVPVRQGKFSLLFRPLLCCR